MLMWGSAGKCLWDGPYFIYEINNQEQLREAELGGELEAGRRMVKFSDC